MRHHGLLRLPGLALLLGLAVITTPAKAGTSQSDVLIAARALGFMENGPKGEVTVGIVYDPSNSQSLQDAVSVRKILGDGLKVGNLVLKPVMLKIEDVGSANVGLFFLTEDVGDHGTEVAVASKAKHIPCVTADIPQVQSGACVMGVRSQPKVEILVNRAAAADNGVAFAAVFRMMITEY